MKRLFDASALMNIVRLLGARTLQYVRSGYTLSLTPYEIGNALWKEATLLNRITLNEATQLINAIKYILKFLNIAEPQNTGLALSIAHELKITYYDASYIITAHELGAELVTDDNKLRKKIEENSEVLQEILGRRVTLRTTEEIT
mgnify:CR=1 FL=1